MNEKRQYFTDILNQIIKQEDINLIVNFINRYFQETKKEWIERPKQLTDSNIFQIFNVVWQLVCKEFEINTVEVDGKIIRFL